MTQGRTIWIDPRDASAARTLLHEIMHLENPSWSESHVLREEARLWKRLHWREKAHLLRMFGRAKVGGEDE